VPSSTRRTDAPSTRKVLAAVGVPVVVAAVAGALTLAGPAVAAGTALPFPTSICGTDTTAASGSSSASPSASATPQTGAAAKTTGTAKAKASASASASPSASSSTSAAANTAQSGSSPSASPSASSSATASGGFWGWLNGVWTWIFGAQQLPQAAAAPMMNAAYVRSGTGTEVQAHSLAQLADAASDSASPADSATCLPSSALNTSSPSPAGDTAAETPWHLSAPSMTMYNLTYNGVTTIKTENGSLSVLDFTASKVTLVSMVTYSHQSQGKLQYVDGGSGQTVTLTGVHLWTTSMTADVLGLIKQTFTPDNPGLLTVLKGITIPIPLLFTNVDADNAFLNTQTIVIPGFNGHGN
jgi:hypothetical protein